VQTSIVAQGNPIGDGRSVMPTGQEGLMSSNSSVRFRLKYLVFAFIAAMMAYVAFHNESFLINPAHPMWDHYRSLGVFLLAHGVAGGSALILAPMQFSDRLRTRYAKVHRVTGRIYVAGALFLAPMGAYVQYLDERLGVFPRSFTIETFVQAAVLMTTTGIGFAFALKRMIPQHRQWMTRSYAAALTFFEIRLIVGIMGWDNDPVALETTVWTCTALAVLVGDIANQIYELQTMRRLRVPAAAAAVAAE
jgi:hypothetical protein